MIRIRFTADAVYRQVAGDVEYVAGSTHDLADDHARRWINRGVAVQIAVRPVIPALQTEPTLPPVTIDLAPVAIAETATAIAPTEAVTYELEGPPETAPVIAPLPLSLRNRGRR